MLRGILLTCVVAAALGCDTTAPDPGLPVKVELLDWAVPPDSLLPLTPEEWQSYPPIVEIEGGEGVVVINGDYTLPGSAYQLVGDARFQDGTLVVLMHLLRLPGASLTATVKLDFQATVSSVPPGDTPVLVRYDVWGAWNFGDIGWGETDVLEETVVVR